MMSQKINCNVKACKHINPECNCCNLSEITVTPSYEVPTAHYCKDYCECGEKDCNCNE